MKNKSLIDFNAIQMLFVLREFKKLNNEIKDIRKLSLLCNLLNYPSKLNDKLSQIGVKNVNIKEFQITNIEADILLQKSFLTLEEFQISLARLVSKSLVNNERFQEESLISISEKGLEIINTLDAYEWESIREMSRIVKVNFGNLSFNQLEKTFQGIMPKILRGGA